MSGVTGLGSKVKSTAVHGTQAPVTTEKPASKAEVKAEKSAPAEAKLLQKGEVAELATTTGAQTATAAAPKAGPKGPMGAAGNNMSIRMAAMQGVDVTKSASKIPSALPMAKLSQVDTKGAAGAVFQLDGGKIQGQRVNLRKIEHYEHGAGIELNLKLRSPEDIAAVMKALEGAGATPGKFELQPMDLVDGKLKVSKPSSMIDPTSYGAVTAGVGVNLEGEAKILKGEGFQVDVMGDGGAAQASRGKVRIRVFGSDDKELQKRLEDCISRAGLKDALAPSDALSQTRLDRMRLLWQAAPQKAHEMFGAAGQADIAAVENALREAKVDEKTLAGTVRKEVFAGHVTTVNPAQVEQYKKLGVEYVFAGIGSADALMSILKSDGMMSSEERMTRGVLVTGASTWEDFRTGGADYVFTRMATKDAAGVDMSNAPFAGSFQIAYKPDVLGRTDWFAYPTDSYGNTRDAGVFGQRLYGEKLIQAIGSQYGGYSSGNEVMFQRGISNDDIMNIFTQSEASRNELLGKLRDAGIKSIAGKPIEELVVVKMKIVDLTPDTLVSKFKTALTTHCLGMTPEVEKFLREAAKKPGMMDTLTTSISNMQYGSPQDIMNQIATATGQTAPVLAFDKKAVQELAKTAFTTAGYQYSPEVAAFFDKVDPAKMPPSSMKSWLDQMSYNGAQQTLFQIGAPCGITETPPVKANPDAIASEFKTYAEQCGLVFTPELDKFVRALVDKGGEAHTLKQAAQSLSSSSQKEQFKNLAAQNGLTPPALKVNIDVATANVKETVKSAGYHWSPELVDYLKKAADAGASPYAIAQLANVAYYDQATVFATIAQESGLAPFKLTADAQGLSDRARAAFEVANLKYTPEVEAFIKKVAQGGHVAALNNMFGQVSYGDPKEYMQQLATAAGLGTPPKVTADVDKMLQAQLPQLQAAYIKLTPELTKFLHDALDKGVSPSSLAQSIGYISYYGAKQQFDAIASSAGIPPPQFTYDLDGLHAQYQQYFDGAGIQYTPAIKQFFADSIAKGQNINSMTQWVQALQSTEPTQLFAAIGGQFGLATPPIVYDDVKLKDTWNNNMKFCGYKLTPEWETFLKSVRAAGMPVAAMNQALQNLQWGGVAPFEQYVGAGKAPALTSSNEPVG